MALLELSDVSVRYGAIPALRDVEFHVDEGEIVALLGANGAGKTTTLRTISGLVHPTTGAISVRRAGDQATCPPHEVVALGIGHVPEGRRIFPRLSVMENLEMGAYRRKGKLDEDFDRVFALFPILEQRRRQDGGTLSGGEQQMLAIGRALMSQPRLLFWTSPRWAWPRSSWRPSSTSSSRSGPRGPPSCWWSKTRPRPCTSPTAVTCSRTG